MGESPLYNVCVCVRCVCVWGGIYSVGLLHNFLIQAALF